MAVRLVAVGYVMIRRDRSIIFVRVHPMESIQSPTHIVRELANLVSHLIPPRLQAHPKCWFQVLASAEKEPTMQLPMCATWIQRDSE